MEPHGVVKLTLTGHLGRGSAASSINDLDNAEPLPYRTALAFSQWFVDRNESALAELGCAMAAATQRLLGPEILAAFPSGVVPKGARCLHQWRNVRDVIYADWRSTLLIHICVCVSYISHIYPLYLIYLIYVICPIERIYPSNLYV